MTLNQSNKMAMYQAVAEVCEMYKSTWEGLPIANVLFTEFKDQKATLEAAALRQEQDFTGITADKRNLKQLMIDRAFVIARALTAYASITENSILAGRVKYSKSDFTSAKDVDVLSKAKSVWEVAQEHVDNLADYGITAQHVTELEEAIANYGDALSSPRVAINQRKEATGSIQQQIKRIDIHLKKKLDAIMVQFDDTEFYSTYQAARMIVDRRGQRRTASQPPQGGVAGAS